jgi:hypothetical protein
MTAAACGLIAGVLGSPAWATEYWGYADGSPISTQDGSDLFDVAKKDCSHWAVDHTVFRLPSGEIHTDHAKRDRLMDLCLRSKGYRMFSKTP